MKEQPKYNNDTNNDRNKNKDNNNINNVIEDGNNDTMDKVLQVDLAEICMFDLVEKGTCTLEEKCKFRHDTPEVMRGDAEYVRGVLTRQSEKLGMCALEFMQKGACKNDCKLNSELNHSRKESIVYSQRKKKQEENGNANMNVCYRELDCIGSCTRTKCWFSHKIPQEMRENQELKEEIKKERGTRISWCVHEFTKKGSCRQGEQCRFNHQISDDQRNIPEKIAAMKEKHRMMRGNRREQVNVSNSDQERTINNLLKQVERLQKTVDEKNSSP